MDEGHFTEDFAAAIEGDDTLDQAAKAQVLRNLARMRNSRAHILITGATGSGKSSTINALFNANHAKVGQGVSPETIEIAPYEYDNVTLYDSPGLGDGPESDAINSQNIISKLREKTDKGDLLIDLVLVVLDGGSRDLGTSFELIIKVIIPNLGPDTGRLLVAINQADMVMKGRFWNHAANHPEPELYAMLEQKISSTKDRIKEATGVDVEPIYYAAGYKDGDGGQHPFNLSKLLLYILRHIKEEKRIVVVQDVNRNSSAWRFDDEKKDYKEEIKKTVLESIISGVRGAWEGVKEVGRGMKDATKALWKSIFG